MCFSLSSSDNVGASADEASRPFQYPLSATSRLHAFEFSDFWNLSQAITVLDGQVLERRDNIMTPPFCTHASRIVDTKDVFLRGRHHGASLLTLQ